MKPKEYLMQYRKSMERTAPKVTNGDRIRAMSDAQLVGFIVTALSAKAIECDYCIHRDEVCRNKRPSRRCAAGMIEWLKSEVRNE